MTDLERMERNSRRYQDMENEVFNIHRMAKCTSLILEMYMEEKRDTGERADDMSCFTAPQLVEHLAPWSDAVDFMVNHLEDMACALRRYYE